MSCPVGEECRLAVPGLGRDEDETVSGLCLEPGGESLARQDVVAKGRSPAFGDLDRKPAQLPYDPRRTNCRAASWAIQTSGDDRTVRGRIRPRPGLAGRLPPPEGRRGARGRASRPLRSGAKTAACPLGGTAGIRARGTRA